MNRKSGIFAKWLFVVFLLSFSQGFTALANVPDDRYMLIPGGDAIGINIQTNGLIVVDTYVVTTPEGEGAPARDAGLRKGDIILEAEGQKLGQLDDYKEAILNCKNEPLILTIDRDGNTSTVEVLPCKNSNGELTTGLYLRNKIAGIGTLTYIDPASNKYGALGHEIIDQDTKQIVDVADGKIIGSNVTSVRKAEAGTPGEKIADISFDEELGTIEKNNEYGIYGIVNPENITTKKMLPIAYQDEIKLGSAQICTVLNGTDIETFDIEIIEINPQSNKEVKGLKYVVTDAKLIDKTGGIVQGMSGSPIIQDGLIIGAVTHVLVHDSTLGYGVFIEWMLEESGINHQNINTKAA